MKCYDCGSEVVVGNHCPSCGADQRPYRRILAASNRAYNEGLERAGVRDLTGAANALNLSLRYNKQNIPARNLLGLVYYESGDVVRGLNEWVISRNFRPDDNPANEYMRSLTKNTSVLKRLGSVPQKYNQSLALCRHGSGDLAKIQLKRVIKKNRRHGMVQAYQLLALMCMRDEDYEDAAEALAAAAKIDTANPLTAHYQKLLSKYVPLEIEGKGRKRPKKKRKRDVIDFEDGNDTVIMPKTSILEAMDSTKSGIVNILVGGAIGILASVFLIFPTLRQNANTEAQSALVTANEKAMSTESNVQNLNKQVKKLKARLENYEGKSDIKGSYENLVIAQRATESKDIDTAGEALSTVNRDLLEPEGQAVYDDIESQVAEKQLEDQYRAGANAFHSSDYEGAIELLTGVVEKDTEYDDGNAMYFLGQSYDSIGDNENAKECYNTFLNSHGGTQRGNAAARYLREIEREEKEAEASEEEE